MPPWRSFRKSVSQPSSAPASNDLFLLNTLCDAVFVLSTLVTGLKNSVIVGNNSEYLSNLTNWINPRRSENDWELCWRKSRDGWDMNKFHSLCDEKGPTITIVKVGNYIFGGYTSLSWRMSTGKYSRLRCLKEHPPNLNNFLLYLKRIYQIENNASTVKNKWEPLVALYKPFDLSLQNLIKNKYLLYISLLFCLVSTVPLYPWEKKGNERAGREKGKNGPEVLTSLFAFSLLLSSQLMLCLLLDVCGFFCFCFCFFFFGGGSFFSHSLLVFNLLLLLLLK